MPIFVIGIKRIAMRSNLIHFDWAMKRLLRDKSNYVVLEGFLSTLLQEEYTYLSVLGKRTNQSDASNQVQSGRYSDGDTKEN